MDKTIFIKNERQYASTFAVDERKEVGEGVERRVIKTEKFRKVFQPKTVNSATGMVENTGFTELSRSEFDDLNKIRVFKSYIESGRFTVYNDAPADALKDTQIIDRLKKENNELKDELKALKKVVGDLKMASKDEGKTEVDLTPKKGKATTGKDSTKTELKDSKEKINLEDSVLGEDEDEDTF